MLVAGIVDCVAAMNAASHANTRELEHDQHTTFAQFLF